MCRYVTTRKGALPRAVVNIFQEFIVVVSVAIIHAGDETSTASIDCLSVNPAHQRKGIATEQLRYAANIFLPTYQKILFVATTNVAGRGLYDHCGWSVVNGPLPAEFEACRPEEDDCYYECRMYVAPVADPDEEEA